MDRLFDLIHEDSLSASVDDLEASPAKRTTYQLQDTLPRLPVPSLEETCQTYLKSLKPLATPEEYEHSRQCVEAFLASSTSKLLQEALLNHNDEANQRPSWLEGWWDDAYLCGRDANAINVNYWFCFEDDPVPEKNSQVGRAASLLRGGKVLLTAALEFRYRLDRQELEPDYERNTALDMSQYPRIFGTARIPFLQRDKLITYTKHKPTGRDLWSSTTEYTDRVLPSHVVVLHKAQFWWFDVIDRGRPVSLEEIESNFNQILHNSKDLKMDPENPDIGVFTAVGRDTWAVARAALLELPGNQAALEKIDTALMLVCLEDYAPATFTELGRAVMHGLGCNRWFDKHQLIVGMNGKAGLCFEHAAGDGTTTLRLADDMYKYSVANGHVKFSQIKAIPRQLEFQLSPELQEQKNAAALVFREHILSTDTTATVFDRYGGNWIKEMAAMSPDAYVQVAVQLAYWKMFGEMTATYEAASTKQFLHGRTETVRTASSAVQRFLESTGQPIISTNHRQPSQQLTLLRAATAAHVDYMRRAKNGCGVDRHLFGLRMLYEENPGAFGEKPAIFTDPMYQRSSHWKLSTSHCGSPSLSLFGFGPVVPQGFGVGYMIKNESISFVITSKFNVLGSSSAVFSTLLEVRSAYPQQSLFHLQSIVLSDPAKLLGPSTALNFTHPTATADIHKDPILPKPARPE